MATAARVKYPAAWQRCKFDTPLLEAGKAGCVITGGTMPYRKKGRLKSPLLLRALKKSDSLLKELGFFYEKWYNENERRGIEHAER